MKKLLTLLIALFLFMPFVVNAETKTIDIHLFYSKECPHCANEKTFLADLEKNNKDIEVHLYELSIKENSNLLDKVQDVIGRKTSYIPYTVIGSQYRVGYDHQITRFEIENIIEGYRNGKYIDVVGGIKTGTITKENYKKIIGEEEIKIKSTIKVPLLGEIDPKSVSIPLLAVVIGFIDGFNPCAMWVLLFLVTMMLSMKDRKRAWSLGLTFIFTSGIVYALFMMAWLNIVVNLTQVQWIRAAIGIFAIGAAAWNIRSFIKDILRKDEGCEVIDDKKRKKIITRIRNFTSQKSFILATLGVIALAISVNVVELACSAGLPLMFSQVLALNDLSDTWIAINISIYIFFFLILQLIIFIIAMVTTHVTGITTKYTKWSHLIGGIIMLILGLLLIFAPNIIMLNI